MCLTFYAILFLHVFGANMIKIGNNSKRPAIISNDNMNLEKFEYPAYPPYGPTFAIPGPILLIQASEALFTFVTIFLIFCLFAYIEIIIFSSSVPVKQITASYPDNPSSSNIC